MSNGYQEWFYCNNCLEGFWDTVGADSPQCPHCGSNFTEPTNERQAEFDL